MRKHDPETQARRRAEIILKVNSGLMTATEAAQQLGISRKTYYKWEKRALAAMLEALTERPSGRPSQPTDGEKTGMRKEIESLKKELLLSEQKLEIHELLHDDIALIEAMREGRGKKKERGASDDR